MASRPNIRDSSIKESQLDPHLRRRLRGGATYQSSVINNYTTNTTAGAVVVSDESTDTPQTVNVEPWALYVQTFPLTAYTAGEGIHRVTAIADLAAPCDVYAELVIMRGARAVRTLAVEIEQGATITAELRTNDGEIISAQVRWFNTGRTYADVTITQCRLIIEAI